MALSDLPQRSGRTFATPYVTDDGSTVVPVVRDRRGLPEGEALGVFVIHDGKASWTPVVDANRVATIGVVTGLVAATLACIAVIRQPPWPKVTLHKPYPSDS